MNTPVESVKGRQLNLLTDRYSREGVKNGTMEELLTQRSELVYIMEMARNDEVRLDFDEYGKFYGMIRYCDELIRKAHVVSQTQEDTHERYKQT